MESEEEYESDELQSLISPTETNEQRSAVENYIFSLYVTDSLKQIFILVIIVVNFISLNIAIILMCLAWYIRSSVEKHITFLQDYYNPQVVPTMVGLSGFVMLVASTLGVKAGIGGRMMVDDRDMKSAADFLFIYAISAAVTFGAVLITALTCFIEIGVLNSALGDGLLAGMKIYKDDTEVKPEIDTLQLGYACCGSESYKDWYNVSWVDTKFLEIGNGFIKRSMKNGNYLGKDVPFSCCRWRLMRPCVDTRLEDSSYNSKYQFPADLTVHRKGCQEAVSGFLGHTIYKGVGLFVLFCSILWVTLAIIGRYLNTSMANVCNDGPSIGWLIPYLKQKRTTTEKAESSREEELESE